MLPSYMSTSGPQETPIFAAIKGGKVWHEPLGGGPASGPETLPGLSGDTVGAFEYEGEVFLVGKDGSLNKPLLARDCLENSPVLFAMMDWTAQAVFVHNSRIFLVKEGKVVRPLLSPPRGALQTVLGATVLIASSILVSWRVGSGLFHRIAIRCGTTPWRAGTSRDRRRGASLMTRSREPTCTRAASTSSRCDTVPTSLNHPSTIYLMRFLVNVDE